jgi:hypothetical protein
VTTGEEPRFAPAAAWVWGGLLSWAAYFLAIYVFAALACERGFAGTRLAGVAVVPLAAVLGLLVTLAVNARLALVARARLRASPERPSSAFRDFLAWALALLGALALVWTALPLLLLQTGCA